MQRLNNLFKILKDRQLLVWLIVAIWSVWTAYYWMVTKIDILAVKVDNYASIQIKDWLKIEELVKTRDKQHEIITSKLWYIMPTVKSLAISHNLPIYEQ